MAGRSGRYLQSPEEELEYPLILQQQRHSVDGGAVVDSHHLQTTPTQIDSAILATTPSLSEGETFHHTICTQSIFIQTLTYDVACERLYTWLALTWQKLDILLLTDSPIGF